MFRKLRLFLPLLLVTVMVAVIVTPVFAQEPAAARSAVYLPLVTAQVTAEQQVDPNVEADLTDTPTATDASSNSSGTVFVTTNSTDTVRGNEVVMYRRGSTGALTVTGRFPTGGFGLGSSLGSQSALILSSNGQWLFTVNGGSNEISVFSVQSAGLVLTDKVASGGVRPTSLTVRKNYLYVLNAGDAGNITGFKLKDDGKLTPLANSTRFLSNNGAGAAPGPGQISFTPDGDNLVVTEKGTSLIDVYKVKNGVATGPVTHPSSGTTPYGFGFGKDDALIISEAANSAASSYEVDGNDFRLVSGSVLNGQTAACWIAIANDGKIAYSINAGTASVSSYKVGKGGVLTLINGRAGDTGAGTGPTDPTVSHNGHFLYVLSPRSQTVIGFTIQDDGSLNLVGSFGGLPLGSAGIAAW